MVPRLRTTVRTPLLLFPVLLGIAACDDATGPGKVTDSHLVRSFSAGSSHTCAINGEGILYCWGQGALGDGTGEFRYLPVRVAGELKFRMLTAGGRDWHVKDPTRS